MPDKETSSEEQVEAQASEGDVTPEPEVSDPKPKPRPKRRPPRGKGRTAPSGEARRGGYRIHKGYWKPE